jgi:hypothetical protein
MAEIIIEFTGQREDINEFMDSLFESTAAMGTEKEIPGGGTITFERGTHAKGIWHTAAHRCNSFGGRESSSWYGRQLSLRQTNKTPGREDNDVDKPA